MMRRNIWWKIPLFVLALLLVSLNTHQAAAQDSRIRVRDLGTLGGKESRAIAINNRGHVVGVSTTATGDNHAQINLGTLGGEHTFPAAAGINVHGQVVGQSATPTGASHAFVWENGHMRDLGTLGGEYSSAAAINDHGQIVGESSTADGAYHAALWVRK